MFQSLDEGIVVLQNQQINFTNEVFNQIVQELEEEEMDVGDRKMFKVYRKTELNDQYKSRQYSSLYRKQPSSSDNQSPMNDSIQDLSLRELIQKDEQFFADKIFEIGS